MSAGVYTGYNKRRPGAYINFKADPSSSMTLSDRGIVAMPLALSWGPQGELIHITGSDFAAGKFTATLGYEPDSLQLQPVREALKNANKVILYRVNKGGKAATIKVGNLTATAVYSGVRGNDLKIAISGTEGAWTVKTYLDNIEIDSQTVAAISDLVANDYVLFSGTGTITASAGVSLATGTDGTTSASDYGSFFTAVECADFHAVAVPTDTSGVADAAKTFAVKMRETLGKKIQVVTYNNSAANYEGIISVKQGYITENEEVSAINFTAYVAGVCAGSGAAQSNTYKVVDGATGIIGEMNDEEIGQALSQGWLVLSKRVDGKIIIEQDINTLTEYTQTKTKVFSKNRVIRTLDEIANTIGLTFQTKYIGKVNNDSTGRDLFKSDIILLLSQLEGIGAITGFDPETDLEILEGINKDEVIVNLAVQTVDAMEKLYMTVTVG